MTLEECARVLTKIQLGDNRQVDQLVLAEWHDTIGHLQYEDAIAGVKRHRQESTEYLQPAHVIKGAKRNLELRAIGWADVYCTVPGHAWYPSPCVRCEEERKEQP